MKTFKVTDKYSISQFDDRNWTIDRKQAVDASKRTKIPVRGLEVANTATYGYYSTLQDAKEALAELVGKEAGNFAELEKWIAEIKKV